MSARYVGIDVSKATLDVWVHPDRSYQRVANTPEGLQALLAGIAPGKPERIVCEASGGYETLLATTLLAAGQPIWVVSPGSVRHFLKGQRRQAKTDKLDAEGLALYAAQGDWTAGVALDPAREELKKRVQRREQVVRLIAQEKTHAEHATGAAAQDIAESLAQLEERREHLDRLITEQLTAHPSLGAQAERLKTVPGIGPVVSAVLVARLPELGNGAFNGIASLAGVAPFQRESGTWKGKARIQGGRSGVRHALYLATLGAIRAKSVVKGWKEAFLKAGKPPKVAVVACMRKLLHLLHCMVRDGITWSELAIVQAAREPAGSGALA